MRLWKGKEKESQIWKRKKKFEGEREYGEAEKKKRGERVRICY